MRRDGADARVIAAVQSGLPLVTRPFAALAADAGVEEGWLRAALVDLIRTGVIKRFGLVVHHRALGYSANAMVVWDVPDTEMAGAAAAMTGQPFVTLCYRRPRRPPHWPYNLFCMIHGRDRASVEAQIAQLASLPALQGLAHETLFSTRCFKQRGARYADSPAASRPGRGTGPAKLRATAAIVPPAPTAGTRAEEVQSWPS